MGELTHSGAIWYNLVPFVKSMVSRLFKSMHTESTRFIQCGRAYNNIMRKKFCVIYGMSVSHSRFDRSVLNSVFMTAQSVLNSICLCSMRAVMLVSLGETV